MKYTLEITEEQAEIIKIALEEYFRLRMNQTWDFADSLCFETLGCEGEINDGLYEAIERRDMFRYKLEVLLDEVHPMRIRGGTFREQTVEMKRAQDICQVIRHKLWVDRNSDKNIWCVDAREPVSMTGEPLPKMERVEE